MTKRCQYYLHEKKRFCSFQSKAGFDKCGNHIEGEGAVKRVPCPIDPHHTVLEKELDWHLPRCPKALQLQEQQVRQQQHGQRATDNSHAISWQAVKLIYGWACRRLQRHHYPCVPGQAQPYYSPDCNAGSSDALDHRAASLAADGSRQTHAGNLSSAAGRIAYARSLGPEQFSALLARIELAYNQVCGKLGDATEVIPGECTSILETPSGQPLPSTQHVKAFTMKHGRQQAAILGQMQQAGVLQDPRSTTFVEFGAGKGYLSCMLAESFGAAELVLVDCNSFRMTADRTLRRLNAKLQRLRVDIKDFEPAGLPSVAGGQPWVAMGKHLCGAATDFTLRCVARSARSGTPGGGPRPPPLGAPSPGAAGSVAAAGQSQNGEGITKEHMSAGSSEGALERFPEAVGRADCAGPTAASGVAAVHAATSSSGDGSGVGGLLGCAVATCCHHRCTWEHYVGKPFFSSLGFSAADFELISWMTGWALCGHGRPRERQAAACSADDEEAASDTDTTDKPNNADSCAAEGDGDIEQARGFEPSMSLPRERRQVIGAQCKRLIDAGRRHYLRENGFSNANAVQYVDGKVSGENWLLLAP